MLSISLPIPPTTNHAYENATITVGKGKFRKTMTTRRLSAAGKAYKLYVRDEILRQYRQHNIVSDRVDGYWLTIELHMATRTKDGRLAKLDVSNRIKLLEDAIVDALGIDDSEFVRLVIEKYHQPDVAAQRAFVKIEKAQRHAGT